MSATHDREMKAVLLRLEMLSHGSTQAWNASGGHSGEPDDRIVTILLRHEEPPHLVFRVRYDRQRNDDGRQIVISEAVEFVQSWVKRDRTATIETRTDRELILEDGEGKPVEWLAGHWNMAENQMRRLRRADGRDPETGLKVESLDRVPDQAAQLSRQGLTQAQIAKRLNVSQPTVHRWLKAERFRRAVP